MPEAALRLRPAQEASRSGRAMNDATAPRVWGSVVRQRRLYGYIAAPESPERVASIGVFGPAYYIYGMYAAAERVYCRVSYVGTGRMCRPHLLHL